jgi:competence protein ComEC
MLGPNQNKNDLTNGHKAISRLEWYVFSVILVAAILSFIAVNAQAIGDGFLRIYFLDVGQGDAEFIQNFNGNQILIDGGPDDKVLSDLAKVMPINDRSIDMVILTHPHSDHITGLIDVLKRYQVGQILENNYPYQAPVYDEWNKIKTNSVVTQAVAGQVIDLGGGVKMTVVFPGVSEAGKFNSNPNNTSVVTRLTYGDESVLFTGDIEAPVEKKLTLNGSILDSDFLKIGHHGSRTSTTEDFLNAVTPKVAFIEVGAGNTFGHPNQEVLDRLANHGIKYYRTDKDGTTELILDGQSFSTKENI